MTNIFLFKCDSIFCFCYFVVFYLFICCCICILCYMLFFFVMWIILSIVITIFLILIFFFKTQMIIIQLIYITINKIDVCFRSIFHYDLIVFKIMIISKNYISFFIFFITLIINNYTFLFWLNK